MQLTIIVMLLWSGLDCRESEMCVSMMMQCFHTCCSLHDVDWLVLERLRAPFQQLHCLIIKLARVHSSVCSLLPFSFSQLFLDVRS